MEFNYDTNNLILFHYPNFAGGKFVMNCMGLSDDMVFQCETLAQKQIDGNFSFDDKKTYILDHLSDEDLKENKRWDDLHLGDRPLYVGDVYNFIDGKNKYNEDLGDYNPVMELLNQAPAPIVNNTARYLSSEENTLKFSIVWHHINLPTDVFPNAGGVTFKNNLKTVLYRTSLLTQIEQDKAHWKWDNGEVESNRSPLFVWDTNWFSDETATINGLAEVYRVFNLGGWEQAESFVKEYYSV